MTCSQIHQQEERKGQNLLDMSYTILIDILDDSGLSLTTESLEQANGWIVENLLDDSGLRLTFKPLLPANICIVDFCCDGII